MSVPNITLNNGVKIPQLGFGVFQIAPENTAEATRTALDIGYRHIDTAQLYRNEAQVGEAVRASGLDRSEVFVTSKISNAAFDPAETRAAFDRTIAALDLDYVDLYLIHWPLPSLTDYLERWKRMEELLETGKVRAIGVSNFQIHHLERVLEHADVTPAVNQIEVHPYLTQKALREFGASHGIVTEAYSPIAQGKVLDDPFIVSIARKLHRTPGQVVLRWHIQRGDVIFPKSTHRERIVENLALFDFEIGADDMAEIDAQNRNERTGGDPDTMAWYPRD